MTRVLRLSGLALILVAAPLHAQGTPARAKTGKAQIVGVVVDSLNGTYLSGADVLVEGATATAETDSAGRFEIDSLSPGTYQVGVFHPVLDAIGITLLTERFHVGPDSSSVVVLAVPSAETLVRRACTRSGNQAGPSAIIGHVTDPETLQPIPRAEVSIAWNEIEVSKTVGIKQTPHILRDTTDRTGAFRLCGLPSSLQATLQARRDAAITAEIPVSLGDRPVELLPRTILLSPVDSAKTGNAVLTGQVLLEGSPSNAGTRVELYGTDIVAMTNEKGEFTMRNLPSGSRVVVARHVGFAADVVPVDLSSHYEQHINIKLPKFVAVMDPVLVTARRSVALDRVGFGQRSRSGMGYFIGPDRLSKMNANQLTDILRMVPGLRVTYGPNGDVVQSSRSSMRSCVQYWLDDMPFTEMEPGDINHFVNGREVVAVEVYQTAAPAKYIQAGGGSCVTVVLWTRFKIRS